MENRRNKSVLFGRQTGRQEQKSGQYQLRHAVGEWAKSSKFPLNKGNSLAKMGERGSFRRGNTETNDTQITKLTENSRSPQEIRYPMGTPKKSFPDFRMYARWSATGLPLLWSLGATFLLPLPPICRPKSQKKKVPCVGTFELLRWLPEDG
jgi:hypothetical protein